MQIEVSQMQTELEKLTSDLSKADLRINARFSHLPTQVTFTAGSARYVVDRASLGNHRCVLSALASGHYKEYQEPAAGESGEPIAVSNVTAKELGILCRFIEYGQLPTLGAHNAQDLLELADRFCLSDMAAQIQGHVNAVPGSIDSAILSDSECAIITASERTFAAKRLVSMLGALAVKATASPTKRAAMTFPAGETFVGREPYCYGYQRAPEVGVENLGRVPEAAWLIIEQRLQKRGYEGASLRVAASGSEVRGFVLQLERRDLSCAEACMQVVEGDEAAQ